MNETWLLRSKNFTQIPNEAVEALAFGTLGNPGARVVLAIFRASVGYRRQVAAISQSTFVARTGLGSATVSRTIQKLLSCNVLQRSKSPGRIGFRYLINHPDIWTGAASVREQLAVLRCKSGDAAADDEDFDQPGTESTDCQCDSRGVAEKAGDHRSGDNSAVAAGSPIKQSLKENNKHTNKDKTNVSVSAEAFESFWLAYPHKDAKPVAEEEFANLNPDDATLAAIMRGLALAKKQWVDRSTEMRYIPFPARWLKERRWEGKGQADSQKESLLPQWWASASGITKKGLEFGLSEGDDGFWPFKMKVYREAGDGPWWDDLNKQMGTDTHSPIGGE